MKIELWIKKEHLYGDANGFCIDCAGEGDAISEMYRDQGHVLLANVDVDLASHRASSAKEALISLAQEDYSAQKEYHANLEKLRLRKIELEAFGVE